MHQNFELMYKYILFSLVGLALFSCKPENKDSYVINVTVDSIANGKLAKLIYLEGRMPKTKDSAIVTSGKINFSGKVDTPEMYYLAIDGIRGNLPFIIENADFEIEINKDTLFASEVSGGKENDLFIEYREYQKNLVKANQEYGQTFREARMNNDSLTMELMRKKYDSLMTISKNNDVEFIKKHSDYAVSALLFEQLYTNKAIEDEKASELYELLSDYAKNTRAAKDVKKLLDINKATAVGSIAPEFSAPDKDGNMIALKDVRGKVTLVDFWAGWCRPCRMENPNVLSVYRKYHDKGLEIIGISLDGAPNQPNAKEAWLKAVEEDSLPWTQVSNLKYFEDPVAKQYNIQSIPSSFILDADGKIVAKNLRGAELEVKIAELLD